MSSQIIDLFEFGMKHSEFCYSFCSHPADVAFDKIKIWGRYLAWDSCEETREQKPHTEQWGWWCTCGRTCGWFVFHSKCGVLT